MTIQPVIWFSLPCEILEFEIEVLPEGAHPEMEAFGVITQRSQAKNAGKGSPPFALQAHLIRKGFVDIDGQSFPTYHQPPELDITAENLVKHMQLERPVERSTIRVARDLVYGTIMRLSDLKNEPPVLGEQEQMIQLDQIMPSFNDIERSEVNHLGLLEPHRTKLCKMLDIDYLTLPERVNVSQDVEILEAMAYRRFTLRENLDGRKKWIPSSRAGDNLSYQIKQHHPLLKLEESKEVDDSVWGKSNEAILHESLKSLNKLLAGPKGTKLDEIQAIIGKLCDRMKSLHGELTEHPSRRLDKVTPVVGTEEQQWDAVKDVIASMKNNTILLSAFTNATFVASVQEHIMRATEQGHPSARLHLFAGEPDRINEADYIKRTQAYGKLLEHNVTTTSSPSHAKFAVSDTGMIWLGSCNLLSCAPGSQIAETGVLIESTSAALDLLDHVEAWFSEADRRTIKTMREALEKHPSAPLEGVDILLDLCEELKTLGWETKAERRKGRYMLTVLSDVLLSLEHKPQYSFLTTEQHRSFVIEAIATSQRSVAFASDQLRSTGMDLTIQNLIIERYQTSNPHFNTFESRIYWGRQWESSRHTDEEIVHGQKLLDNLRKRCKYEIKHNYNWKGRPRLGFFPVITKGPMGTHAKFLIQDNLRTLVTSLNLFGGKSEEFDAIDATELGIIIDCGRLAHVFQGEMDLMMGTGYIDRHPKKVEAFSHLFQSVFYTALADEGGSCTLEELMERFFTRIFNTKQINDFWHQYMTRTKEENSLQVALNVLRSMEPRIIVEDMVDEMRRIPLKTIHTSVKNGADVYNFTELSVSHRVETLESIRDRFEIQ